MKIDQSIVKEYLILKVIQQSHYIDCKNEINFPIMNPIIYVSSSLTS